MGKGLGSKPTPNQRQCSHIAKQHCFKGIGRLILSTGDPRRDTEWPDSNYLQIFLEIIKYSWPEIILIPIFRSPGNSLKGGGNAVGTRQPRPMQNLCPPVGEASLASQRLE